MQKTFPLIAAVIGTVCLTTPALAWDHCTDRPRNEWMTIGQATTKAESQGYRIYEIERDGTCYELEGRDKSGARVEIHMDPVSGEIQRSHPSHPRVWRD